MAPNPIGPSDIRAHNPLPQPGDAGRIVEVGEPPEPKVQRGAIERLRAFWGKAIFKLKSLFNRSVESKVVDSEGQIEDLKDAFLRDLFAPPKFQKEGSYLIFKPSEAFNNDGTLDPEAFASAVSQGLEEHLNDHPELKKKPVTLKINGLNFKQAHYSALVNAITENREKLPKIFHLDFEMPGLFYNAEYSRSWIQEGVEQKEDREEEAFKPEGVSSLSSMPSFEEIKWELQPKIMQRVRRSESGMMNIFSKNAPLTESAIENNKRAYVEVLADIMIKHYQNCEKFTLYIQQGTEGKGINEYLWLDLQRKMSDVFKKEGREKPITLTIKSIQDEGVLKKETGEMVLEFGTQK